MGKVLTVETGSAGHRYGQTRFVEVVERPPDPVPVLGDPWCEVTVRARLHRVNWVLTKDPKVGPADVRCCMPETVREVFKDLPGEPMRIPVPRADQDATNDTLKAILTLKHPDDRAVVYALAAHKPDTDLATMLRCSDKTARTRKLTMLKRLADDWNRRGWKPDDVDVARAERLLHRKVK